MPFKIYVEGTAEVPEITTREIIERPILVPQPVTMPQPPSPQPQQPTEEKKPSWLWLALAFLAGLVLSD